MARRLFGAAAVLLVGLTFMSATAGAASGSQTFRFLFTGDPHEGAVGRVIATGVINAAGTDRNVGSQPNPDGTVTDLDEIALPGGTITIRDTDTFSAFTLDPTTCVARISVSGPYTVVAATGVYTGATGNGTFTGTGILVFNRTPGGCSEQTRAFFVDVTAQGSLSIP